MRQSARVRINSAAPKYRNLATSSKSLQKIAGKRLDSLVQEDVRNKHEEKMLNYLVSHRTSKGSESSHTTSTHYLAESGSGKAAGEGAHALQRTVRVQVRIGEA